MNDHPVMMCEQRLIAAQLSGDCQELERLLADELIYTGLSGELGNKQDDLALHRSGRFRITRMNMLERQTRDLGTTVVVVALMDTAAQIDGDAMTKLLRYTRIWTLRKNQWLLAAAHISEVAQRVPVATGAS